MVREVAWELGDQQSELTASQLISVIHQHSQVVHEAAAWLVTEIVSKTEPRARATKTYRSYTDNLRLSLEAMPAFPGNRLEDIKDDFDPLFFSTVHIIQAAAAYALSPPFILDMIRSPPQDPVRFLGEHLKGKADNPLSRLFFIQEQLRKTPYPIATEWSRWVRSWFFRDANVGEATLAPKRRLFFNSVLGHSGLARKHIAATEVGLFCEVITRKRFRDALAFANLWAATEEYRSFEPHVHPLFQTCLIERPKLITPYYWNAREPPIELARYFDHVIVSLLENDGFDANRLEAGKVSIQFGPHSSDRVSFWYPEISLAKEFLTHWAKLEKGILTDSRMYDFNCFDLRHLSLLEKLPHVVVASSDLRTVWNKLTVLRDWSAEDGKKEIGVASIAGEAAGHYCSLIFKVGERLPLVMMPALAKVCAILPGLPEELGSDVELYIGSEDQVRDWISACEPSAYAATVAFSDYH